MVHFNLLVLFGGLLGYLVSIIASTALVLLFLRLNARMFPHKNALRLLLWEPKTDPKPSPAPAIALGAATLSQAYLLRHAVFAVMSMVQDLLAEHGDRILTAQFPFSAFVRLAALSALLFLVIALLSVLSIWLAGAFFNFLTGEMNELEEIEKGNIAVAILFAFVLFAVTMLLNEGIEEVARALVPYSQSGVRLP
ncbi:MAG: hypothetical protein QOH06_1539 [Acidobacteriota bacterium]|jgi:uncharacterized membrane protein YjfL (UPF0719 family)|nr:hypothetical protein [Acidobacteriota bacterium]